MVQANNELKELQAREEKEIDRVLRILSGECAAQRENILYDYDLLAFSETLDEVADSAAKPVGVATSFSIFISV